MGLPALEAPRDLAAPAASTRHEGASRARATTDPGFGVGVAQALEVFAAPEHSPQGPDRASERPGPISERPRHAVTYDERMAWAETAAKPKRSILLPALAAALALLAVVGGAVGALLAHRSTESRVRARVTTLGGHESLVVEVPRAGFGARVRFRGQEVPLVAARAVLPLATPLAIGENRLALGLVDDEGNAEELPLDVTVAYRMRPDLTAIHAEPPRFRVKVDALPGSVVTLGGERIALDRRGHAERDFPLRGRPVANVITETVRYRVVPPSGEAETGEVTARIPLATLELDRPGSALVTDADTVAVEGAVHSTATVTVNGVPVAVRDGHFKHLVELPRMGEHHITVVAREAGYVPDRESVVVRRVADLDAEARAYEVDPSLTYARIAADPDGSRGRRVALEGVVYNVDVRRGQSMLQVLVSRCGEARCPIWVTYPAATEVELNQAVRVLGEVDGEQRFRTNGPTEQILTVPRVRAVYVLPITP